MKKTQATTLVPIYLIAHKLDYASNSTTVCICSSKGRLLTVDNQRALISRHISILGELFLQILEFNCRRDEWGGGGVEPCP